MSNPFSCLRGNTTAKIIAAYKTLPYIDIRYLETEHSRLNRLAAHGAAMANNARLAASNENID